MWRNGKVQWRGMLAVLLVSLLLYSTDIHASNSKDYLDELNAGVAVLMDTSAYNSDSTKDAIKALNMLVDQNREDGQSDYKEDLFMANVQMAMNVRKEPDEKSAKVGVLYKDCGGHVLDRKDGWTKIQSGELIGWAKDSYLLFGEEAAKMADDVGFKTVVVESDTLAMRKEANENAEVIGLLAMGDALIMDEVIDDTWVAVEYEGEVGYVAAAYVSQDFQIDAGETMRAIELREAAEEAAREEARKKELTRQREAMIANADEVRLLGALIQCEAGVHCYDGMIAVGAVVMNRVKSPAYPNTIASVIYASGQFTPALNGKVAKRYNGTVNPLCIQAAQAAINGQTNVGDATHFRRAGNHDGIEIGGQVFW